MKQLITISISIFFAIAIKAQDNTPKYKLDEIISSPECSEWDEIYQKTAFAYDQKGNLISQIIYESVDGIEWSINMMNHKYEFTYDEHGNLTSEVESEPEDVPIEGFHWEQGEKVEFTHNEHGDLASYTEYYPEYNYNTESYQYTPSANANFTYKNDGNTIAYDWNSYWDAQENAWLITGNHYITLDEQKRIIEKGEIEYMGDPEAETSTKEITSYNDAGTIVSTDVWIKFKPGGEWGIIGKMEYTYDEMDNLLSVVLKYIHSETGEITETEIQEKYDYQYDEEGRMIVKTVFGTPFGGYDWIERERQHYEYDDKGLTASISYFRLTTFYYAGEGEVDSLMITDLEEFQYDDHGNKIEKITTQWDEYDNSLSGKSRTLYAYDYGMNRNHFRKPYGNINIPEIYLSIDLYKEVLDNLLFDDRILVEEITFMGFEEFENEQGETETRWLNPCTQKYNYSKLE
ncbi:MAG: hypothetical protein ISS19_04190 [Bacteroidales bacterium]|nr:hypothetical protein [Bacteroidales bacterium]